MKPSERILTANLEHDTAQYLPRFLGVKVNRESILAYLDEEHERRQTWETKVEEAIKKLERLANPMRYFAAPEHQSEAERAKLIESLKTTGATLLPPGAELVHTRAPAPIPCAVAMPAPHDRVLFLVPSMTEHERWRTGMWHHDHPDGPFWEDDCTSVGDETISYSPEEVTHWLPMPEVPT